jgi:type I restriction enzyme R subunit
MNTMIFSERDLEQPFIEKLRDRAALEKNFRGKFEALNRVKLTDGEFQRLLEEIITRDVFAASQTQKLEALKTHKKGLMQRLFPSPEEVEA